MKLFKPVWKRENEKKARKAAADRLAALYMNTDSKNIYGNLLQNC